MHHLRVLMLLIPSHNSRARIVAGSHFLRKAMQTTHLLWVGCERLNCGAQGYKIIEVGASQLEFLIKHMLFRSSGQNRFHIDHWFAL